MALPLTLPEGRAAINTIFNVHELVRNTRVEEMARNTHGGDAGQGTATNAKGITFRDLGFDPNAPDFDVRATEALLNRIFGDHTSVEDDQDDAEGGVEVGGREDA